MESQAAQLQSVSKRFPFKDVDDDDGDDDDDDDDDDTLDLTRATAGNNHSTSNL